MIALLVSGPYPTSKLTMALIVQLVLQIAIATAIVFAIAKGWHLEFIYWNVLNKFSMKWRSVF